MRSNTRKPCIQSRTFTCSAAVLALTAGADTVGNVCAGADTVGKYVQARSGGCPSHIRIWLGTHGAGSASKYGSVEKVAGAYKPDCHIVDLDVHAIVPSHELQDTQHAHKQAKHDAGHHPATQGNVRATDNVA
eukprot:364255-Chlamydomonas_euryale.AAC.2